MVLPHLLNEYKNDKRVKKYEPVLWYASGEL